MEIRYYTAMSFGQLGLQSHHTNIQNNNLSICHLQNVRVYGKTPQRHKVKFASIIQIEKNNLIFITREVFRLYIFTYR